MLEPPRTSAKALQSPCYLCAGEVRVGLMRFNVFLNNPELVHKHVTHLAISVVHVGSMRFDVLEPPRTSE